MAQSPGMLNTAPSPIPGGFGNPTGMNIGLPTGAPGAGGFGGTSTGYPPAFGSIPTTQNPANTGALPQSFFPANTGGGALPPSLAGLSSGLGQGPGSPWYQNLYNELGRAYGKGTGQTLGDLITKGMFNPQVAQSLMAAMEPNIERGLQDVMSSFGSEGARFSSAGAIGAGDYMSQARLGQNAILANMFQQDQMAQLGLLQGAMPTLHLEEANRPSALKDILGVGEIAAGALLGSPSLIGSGGGMLTGAGAAGGGGGAAGGGGITSWLQKLLGGGQQTPFGSVGGVSDPALGQVGAIPGGIPPPFDPTQPLPGTVGTPDFLGAQVGSLFSGGGNGGGGGSETLGMPDWMAPWMQGGASSGSGIPF